MIHHRNTLISEDIFEKRFVCDLAACEGGSHYELHWDPKQFVQRWSPPLLPHPFHGLATCFGVAHP